MKKFSTRAWLLSGALLCLAGCQQVAEEPDDVESRTVRLSINATTYAKADIGGWEEEGLDDVEMAGQPASRAASEAVGRMAFALIDEDGNLAVQQEKTDESSDYLTLKAEVPYGKYKLVAVGHNGGADAVIGGDSIVSFTESKLTDTFLYYRPLELDAESDASMDITLTRRVAKFTVKHTDAMPANVATVVYTVTGGGNTLYAPTGLADKTVEQVFKITIPASAAGTRNNNIAFYTFLPEEECSLTVTATAKDADGEVIISRTFEDAPMEVNMQTVYTGAFFTNAGDTEVSASVESGWKESKQLAF